jgi:hypothetical protein
MGKRLTAAIMALVLTGCGPKPPELNPLTPRVEMKVGEVKLQVEVRTTDEERELVLSYRESLGENEGMLFVFNSVQPLKFWMKGMNFDLDMIWIREGKVVEISENIPAPLTESETLAIISPKEPADMILEVNAGWAKRNGIETGAEVVLDGQSGR